MPELQAGEIPSITYRGPSETIEINKWHFLFVLERMRTRNKWSPRGEWCLVALGIFLTALQSLLTAEFKDALGAQKEVWHAFMTGVAYLGASATLVLGAWWAVDRCLRKPKTTEQLLDEILDQMARDLERASTSASKTPDPPAPETARPSPQ